MIDKQMEITLAPLNAPALVLAIEQIMLMQDKAVRLENAAAEIERYATSRSATTVPMEMLWRIAGEGLAANGGRRVDEAKLRGIAAKYGYKVEEGSS